MVESSAQPPSPHSSDDMFGESPWQKLVSRCRAFAANPRALRISIVILLAVQMLRMIISVLPRLSMYGSWNRNMQTPIERGVTLIFLGICVYLVVRSKAISLVTGFALTQFFFYLYENITFILTITFEAVGPIQLPGAAGAVITFLILILWPVTIGLLYLLQKQIDKNSIESARTAIVQRTEGVPAGATSEFPLHAPVLTYDSPSQHRITTRQTTAMILLWIIASLWMLGLMYVLIVNLRFMGSTGVRSRFIPMILYCAGPAVSAAFSAVRLKRSSINGLHLMIGMLLGFGAVFIASTILSVILALTNISMGSDLLIFAGIIGVSGGISALYIAGLRALYRVCKAMRLAPIDLLPQ